VTPDQYLALLQSRRDEHEAEHPARPGFPALLEWFVRDGDEELFTPPAETPKPAPQPRHYRSAASLRAERDYVAALRDRVADSAALPDVAASRGLALGARGTARHQQASDRALARHAALTARIDHLDWRIGRAERRETP
jgi:hypothetical protein